MGLLAGVTDDRGVNQGRNNHEGANHYTEGVVSGEGLWTMKDKWTRYSRRSSEGCRTDQVRVLWEFCRYLLRRGARALVHRV